MIKHRLVSFFVALAFAGLAAMPARAETTLKVNIWPHINHNIVALVVIPWTNLMRSATGDAVRFDVPAGSLAAADKIHDAMVGGVLDVGFIIPGYTPARFPSSRMVEFPLIGANATALSVAYWRTYQKYFANVDEYKGVKVLSVFTHPPGNIISKKPITSLDDIKGMKLRVGGGVIRDVAKELGTVPVAVPATQAYEVLSKGVADGIFFPPEGALTFKLMPVLSYYYEVPGGMYNSAFTLAINGKKWDGLSKKIQGQIESVSGEMIARIAGNQWTARDEIAVEEMEKAGIKTTVADEKAVARLREIGGKLEAEWIEEVGKKGVDGQAALNMLRSEAAKLTN